MIDGHIAVLSQ